MTRRVTKKVRDLTFRDLGRLVEVEAKEWDPVRCWLPKRTHTGYLRNVSVQWAPASVRHVMLSLTPDATYAYEAPSFDVGLLPGTKITVLVPDAEIALGSIG